MFSYQVPQPAHSDGEQNAIASLEFSYRSVGVREAAMAYVTGNFGRPGFFGLNDKTSVLSSHFLALRNLIAAEGTLVMPSFSWGVLSSPYPIFDPIETPSETGPMSELLRRHADSQRSIHPLASVVGLGPDSEALARAPSPHAYGPLSPWDVMIQRDAIFVSVGMPLERTISLVHHVEHIMAVPYRFVKMFRVAIRLSRDVLEEREFFLQVLDKGEEIKRGGNACLLREARASGLVRRETLGNSFVESIRMLDFVNIASELMARDPFVWLAERPKSLPYQRFS